MRFGRMLLTAMYCCMLLALPAPSMLGIAATYMLLFFWAWWRAGTVLWVFSIRATQRRWLPAGAAVVFVSLLVQLTAAAHSWTLEWAGLSLGPCLAVIGVGMMSQAYPQATLARGGIVDGFRFVSWKDVRECAWADDDQERLTVIWDGAWTGRNDMKLWVPAEQREAVERLLRERVPAATPESPLVS